MRVVAALLPIVIAAHGCTRDRRDAATKDPANTPPTRAPSSVPAPSASSASPVCTFGQDQTCNENIELSSLTGVCEPDGSCRCKPSHPKNPATGLCR